MSPTYTNVGTANDEESPDLYTLPVSRPPDTSHSDEAAAQSPPTAHPSTMRSSDAPAVSPHSLELVRSAAAHLLDLGCSGDDDITPPMTDSNLLPAGVHGEKSKGASPASDGIFIPGSAYLEFHSALRHHTFNAARSAAPSRYGTPERATDEPGQVGLQEYEPPASAPRLDAVRLEDATLSAVPMPTSVELSQQQEYELWKNWVDEIAPWVSPPTFRIPDTHVKSRLVFLKYALAHPKYQTA